MEEGGTGRDEDEEERKLKMGKKKKGKKKGKKEGEKKARRSESADLKRRLTSQLGAPSAGSTSTR